MAEKIREGDAAPDFSLASQDGRRVSLRDFRGRKNVVLYFYPKDFTVGCTAEAKTFSSNYQKIASMGAEVLGISSDSTETHKSFGQECEVEFPLLSDHGGKVREAYGAESWLGLVPGRVTFVIDKDGLVRKTFSSQARPKKRVSEAIEALESL
ncbi:MAG: peroxiredoxin [Thaumarchaeota archaeon]|nr:peroxiredoxin [Nitrososphaerota archaeon]